MGVGASDVGSLPGTRQEEERRVGHGEVRIVGKTPTWAWLVIVVAVALVIMLVVGGVYWHRRNMRGLQLGEAEATVEGAEQIEVGVASKYVDDEASPNDGPTAGENGTLTAGAAPTSPKSEGDAFQFDDL